MTGVKVCGVTREEDVDLACRLGARWIGLNFAAESPRRLAAARARDVAAAVPAGVGRVGVFVRESLDEIRRAIDAASLDAVQIHRPLREEDLGAIARPVFAVVRVSGPPLDLPAPESLERCGALLFDAAPAAGGGGTGRMFDWSLLEGRRWSVPFLVAGGLTPENVGIAIAQIRPDGVDVASGVEASPGVKDPTLLSRFFQAVGEADARLA